MSIRLRRFSLLVALLITASVPVALHAQELNLYMTADSDVATPDDRVTYTATVSNTGAAELTQISVALERPDLLSFPTVASEGITCFSPGNACTWEVSSLAPGESRTVHFAAVLGSGSPAGPMTFSATASAGGVSDVPATVDVVVDPTPLLRLSVAADEGPARPGVPLTYTITYGNIGSSSPSNVVLRVAVPEGSDFSSASEGGIENAGVVTWDVGVVGVGAGGQVRMTVTPDAALPSGSVLIAEAEIDPGAPSDVVRSAAQTPVASNAPLHVRYAASQTAVNRGERLIYKLTASNSGPVDVTDIEVRMLRPQHLDFSTSASEGFVCFSPGSLCTWTIDALAPGASREIFFYASVGNQAPSGDVLRSVLLARSNGSAQVSAALDAQVDPTPLLRLSLAPDNGPAVHGEPFTYTLTYGNVGSTVPTDVVLRMALPLGTDFVHASDGGMLRADTVTWNVGTVGAGAGGQVRLTVRPNASYPEGRLLSARAEIDSRIATEYVVRSHATTPVGNTGPLRVAYGLSQSSIASSERVVYTLTASNAGATDLTGIEIRLLAPEFIGFSTISGSGFVCFSPGITCIWTVGTLAPGDSRQLIVARNVATDASQGEILRSRMLARSDASREATAALDSQVDQTPLLQLSLANDGNPATAGDPLTYYMSFSNVGTGGADTTSLRMPIPEGTQFVSATCGARINDDVVMWEIDPLAAGEGGRFFVSVVPDATLSEGELLTARAEFDSRVETEYVAHSTATTPIGSNLPLEVDLTPSRRAANPGDTLTYWLTVTNTGPADLLDVEVGLYVPSLTFFVSPNLQFSGTAATWAVGALPPGETRRTSIAVTLPPESPLSPRGLLLRTWTSAEATGSRQVTLQDDVILGSRANFAPQAAAITTPDDGAVYIIGGAENEDPVRPDSLFVVEWEAPCDPEEDVLTYRWQLSASDDFGSLLLDEPSAGAGTATGAETEFGTLAEVLSANGVVLGESITLYHRVVAHDGQNQAVSDARRIVLTRGTIVGVEEDDPHLPTRFALHGNYPNPFNPATTFAFDLPEAVDVELTVFDGIGRSVATVVSGRHAAGTFRYVWDAGHLPSGVYFYRLNAGAYTEVKKLILLK